jgi:hypothetical protein
MLTARGGSARNRHTPESHLKNANPASPGQVPPSRDIPRRRRGGGAKDEGLMIAFI